MNKIILMFVCAFVVGCAHAEQYVPFPNQSVELEDPSKARFYVVRPTIFGSAVEIKVYDQGKPIGKTIGKTYLSWEREPGDIIIRSHAENDSNLLINAVAGQVYYIQQHIRMGMLYARNWLEELDAEKGRKYVEKSKSPRIKETKNI